MKLYLKILKSGKYLKKDQKIEISKPFKYFLVFFLQIISSPVCSCKVLFQLIIPQVIEYLWEIRFIWTDSAVIKKSHCCVGIIQEQQM